MAKIVVLGGGRIGRVIARDLADDQQNQVTVTDFDARDLDQAAERWGYQVHHCDLSDKASLLSQVEQSDIVVGALPGAIGLETLQMLIPLGKPVVDISFMPEDPRSLQAAAQKAGTVVLYDFGLAPGMSHLLAARGAIELEGARHISILVGGLPAVRRKPWEYTAPFSPADIIEEYVRPARVKVNGKVMQRPALSGVELIDFPGLGTLEAFHTDGLRSLIETLDCPSMEEKTLRYPGHAAKIRLLRDSGFFSTGAVRVGDQEVSPREMTLKLLEPEWAIEEDTDEFTVMRITVIGGDAPPYKRIVWNLLDRTDRYRGETSLSRTTGFMASIATRRLLDGTFQLEPGIHPPEALAGSGNSVDTLLADLKARGVNYMRNGR